MVQRQEFKKDILIEVDWKDDWNRKISHDGHAEFHILKDTDGDINYYSVLIIITSLPKQTQYVIKEVLFPNHSAARDYMGYNIAYYTKSKNIFSMAQLKKEGFEYDWSY